MATLVFIILSGCAPALPAAPTPLPPLNPLGYATQTLPPVPSPVAATAAVPIPTPTPFTYTIARGDTLIAIADRFGVTINDILRVNPDIVPQALSVGQTISIPSVSSDAARPTPVPAGIELGPVQCFPSGAGMWCLVLAHNPLPDRAENLIAQVSLLDAAGNILDSQSAYALLDSLSAGESLPLAAFFAAPQPGATPRADLTAATRLQSLDPRYLALSVQNTQALISWDGRSAQLTGQILLSGAVPATRAWVLAIAYDKSGNPIGQRRWEWNGGLQPDGLQSFSFSVYSLGPAIDRVTLLGEARP